MYKFGRKWLTSKIPGHNQRHGKFHHLTRLHTPNTRQSNPTRCTQAFFTNHKHQEQHEYAKGIEVGTDRLIDFRWNLRTDKQQHKTNPETDFLTNNHPGVFR